MEESVKAVGLICVAFAMLLAGSAQAGTVYFLVSEFPGAVSNGDSFVLPLSKADDISHARDLIRLGTSAGRPLVFADIVAGGDHINRNLLASNSPSWSWRISRFDSFADGGIELVDGWPNYIEHDVPGWINNTGGGTVDSDGDGRPDGGATIGKVGFWGYTVTAELGGNPYHLHPVHGVTPAAVAVPLPAALPAGAALLGALGVLRFIKRPRQSNA
jgi:hypothetical protein